MSDFKWPSFTIQGIILATNISFSLGDKGNIWIIISIFFVLLLFSLQTTHVRWTFLFPRSGADIDTHILRIITMFALTFLFVGIYEAIKSPIDIPWIILAVFGLVVVPLIFNFCINDKIPKIKEHNKNKETGKSA